MSDESPDDGRDRSDEPSDPAEEPTEEPSDGGGIGRRDLLRYGALATVGVGAAAGGGYALLSGDEETPGEWAPAGDGEEGSIDRETVEAFAPLVEFGAHERWYPTDPRQYAEERDGEAVVDGFAALDGYTEAFREAEAPPDPVVFYRTLAEQNSSLGVVQYWLYSAFDQFAVNFHWHDWELVQVFFDRETGDPALIAASSHSRRVPNNEHLGGGEGRIGILAETGSHSSATDVDRNGQFSRLDREDLAADVTNALVRIAEDNNPLPLAYGLPRGEGGVLPYVVPELDGAPLYEHPDLPNVRAEDLIDEPLAVRDLSSLATPPGDVPGREPGLRFRPDVDDTGGDDQVGYRLEPIEPVADAIDDFGGPQLSFEFPVPGIVEDQFANHITSVGLPWAQPRYDDPLADVTDAAHRAQLVESFGLDGSAGEAEGEVVVAQVEEASTDTDGEVRGAPDAATTDLEPEIGYTLSEPSVESVALLESDPVAVPTAGGAVRLTGVEPGEHRLIVDGAGYAPHAERVSVGGDDGPELPVDGLRTGGNESDDGSDGDDATGSGDAEAIPATRAGAEGYLAAVPEAEAVKLRAEATDAPGGIDRVRIAEDYAGPAFDGRPAADDGEGFAAYVHRQGSYVVDVVDGEGVPGTDRVRPGRDGDDGDDGEAQIDLSGETGKASLAEFLAEYLLESADLTREYRREDDTDDGTTTTTRTTGNGGGNGGDEGETTTTTAGGSGGGGGAPGVPEVFESAAGAAERAADFARDGQLDQADGQLETVRNRLDALRTRIEAQRGGVLPDTLATVLRDRVEGSDRRAEAALAADR